jgi:hypothetical protein
MQSPAKALTCCSAGIVLLLGEAPTARAADTYEPWDAGASGLEFYLAGDGLASGRGQGALSGELLLDYGVAPGLSLLLDTTLRASDTLQGGQASLAMTVYATPVDSAHVDLDLFLELQLAELRQMVVTPSLELNLDERDDRSSFGAYLRLGLPVYGLDDDAPSSSPLAILDTGVHAEATLGAYLVVSRQHQLLVELSGQAHPSTEAGSVELRAPGLALGYNAMLLERFELISQVGCGLPDANGVWPVGVVVGFISYFAPGGSG